MKGKFQSKPVKKAFPAALAGMLLLVLAVSLILARCSGVVKNAPTLSVETPQKLSASETDTFTLAVQISDLGNARYPAMSLSLRFDPSCLEFLGIEEGNVFVTSADAPSGRMLPRWSCNPQQCNKNGLINIMYLDLTGGQEAFDRELLAEEDNVLVRLSFRLRGSARKGDVYDLVLEDAVFAASDEAKSLAMNRDTLNVKNAKIVVGD